MKDLLLNHPEILETLIDLLVVAFTALVTAATAALIKWLKARGIELDATEQEQLKLIGAQGAAYAEEWGRARAKGGEAPSGSEKLAVAIRAAKELAKGRLAKVAEKRLGVAVQAALPALRAQSLPPPAPVQWDELARASLVPPRGD